MLEIETKFKVPSEKAIASALKRLGARFEGRAEERDIYYYPPRGVSAVRLRSGSGRTVFTVKIFHKGNPGRGFKIRNEFEAEIKNEKAFQNILKALGFKPAFRKEKKRLLYSWRGAKISVDRLPFIGTYLEIEGKKAAIRRAAKKLGLDMKNASASTYMDIFGRYKKLKKKPKLELVF